MSILAVSCGSVNQNFPKAVIETTPTNAMIYAENGELLGTSPLKLTSEQLAKVSKEKFLKVTLKKAGFQEKTLVLPYNGPTEINVPMEALSSDHFKEWVLSAYGKETNELLRTVLEAQGLMISKRNDDAKELLLKLEGRYKNLSAVYTLLAIISMEKKDFNGSRSYLVRALTIDPEDSTAHRLMKKIESDL